MPATARRAGSWRWRRPGSISFDAYCRPFCRSSAGTCARLLRDALRPSQPVLLLLPLDQGTWISGLLDLSEAGSSTSSGSHVSSQPVLNVMVVAKGPAAAPASKFDPSPRPRSAGTSWRGLHYAEVYVDTDEDGRARFLAFVLAAMAGQLLSERRVALYRIDEQDTAGQAEAFEVGFRRSGERSLLVQAMLRPEKGGAED
jgi:hypothetical protein